LTLKWDCICTKNITTKYCEEIISSIANIGAAPQYKCNEKRKVQGVTKAIQSPTPSTSIKKRGWK
jgi:hypothetical protein